VPDRIDSGQRPDTVGPVIEVLDGRSMRRVVAIGVVRTERRLYCFSTGANCTPRDAVAGARMSDAEQAEFLAGALTERRARIARAWLDALNGAERFAVREAAPGRWTLECEDTAVRAGLRQGEDVTFAMTLALPDAGERWGFQTRGAAKAAFDLVPFLPPAWLHRFDARRYAIAEIRAWDYRGRTLTGTARVHLYFDRDSGPRIVGVERD
jgi:hypothetical protein